MTKLPSRILFIIVALAVLPSAHALVKFQDDFNDGNADGWSFFRNDASQWGC